MEMIRPIELEKGKWLVMDIIDMNEEVDNDPILEAFKTRFIMMYVVVDAENGHEAELNSYREDLEYKMVGLI